MTLAKLIRGKNESAEVATATPATFATLGQESERTVATVATVAVAKPENSKAAAHAPTSRGWLIRYPNGSTVEVFILLADGSCPNRAQVLMDYVGACDAAPIPEGIQSR